LGQFDSTRQELELDVKRAKYRNFSGFCIIFLVESHDEEHKGKHEGRLVESHDGKHKGEHEGRLVRNHDGEHKGKHEGRLVRDHEGEHDEEHGEKHEGKT